MRFPGFTNEWKETTIGECTERLSNGLTYDTTVSQGLKVCRIETIHNKSIDYQRVGFYNGSKNKVRDYFMKTGDILFSHINSLPHIGKTAIYGGEEPLIHGMNLLLIRSKSTINPYYLYYLLNTNKVLRRCQIIAKPAVNQASISINDLKGTPIHICDRSEQEKIAHLLWLIDEQIATQNKIIEDLKKLKSAIYDKVFQPINGERLPLGDLADIIKGQQVNGEFLTEDGDYYVMNGGVEPSGYYHDFNTSANTISLSEGGNSCGYVQWNSNPFWSGGHCYTLDIKDSSIDNKYLYHFLKWREADIMKLRIGSGLPNIQKKDLAKVIIEAPRYSRQTMIVRILDAYDSKIENEMSVLELYQCQKLFLLSQMFI